MSKVKSLSHKKAKVEVGKIYKITYTPKSNSDKTIVTCIAKVTEIYKIGKDRHHVWLEKLYLSNPNNNGFLANSLGSSFGGLDLDAVIVLHRGVNGYNITFKPIILLNV